MQLLSLFKSFKPETEIVIKKIKHDLPIICYNKNQKGNPLWDHQKQAFNKHKNSRFRMIIASGGSGKSKTACYIASNDISTTNLKILLAVPQQVIAQDFVNDMVNILPNGEKINWSSYEIFDQRNGNKNGLRQFLESPIKNNAKHVNRAAVCSHQTLVALYNELDETEFRAIFGNVSLFIDEAHHVCMTGGAEFDDDNRLGQLVNKLLESDLDEYRLALITATPFRGDGKGILLPKFNSRFTVSNYMPYEHLERIGIQSVQYNIATYKDSPDKELNRIIRKVGLGNCPCIFGPQINSICATGFETREDMADAIEKAIPVKLRKSKRIMNFIRKEDQKELKKIVVNSDGNIENAIFIFVGMGKEGFNSVATDTVFMIGNKRSITEILQIIYRTFRYYPGKKHVKIWHIIPRAFSKDSDKTKEHINKYLNIIFKSMCIADYFRPIEVLIKSKRKNGKSTLQKLNAIDELYPDQNDKAEFIASVQKEWVVRVDENNAEEDYKLAKELLIDIIKEYDIDDERALKVARQIWARNVIMCPDVSAKNNDEYPDIDFIFDQNPLGFIYGNVEKKTLREIAEYYRSVYTIDDLKNFSKENGGDCLSDKYIGANEKYEWQCSCSHIWLAQWKKIQCGQWCPYCIGKKGTTIKTLQDFAKSKNGKCLSNHYITGKSKYTWQCDKEHVWITTWESLKHAGSWCPYCTGRKGITIEKMQEYAESKGGKCLSDKYTGSHGKYEWQCNNLHIWTANATNILNNYSWCPYCSKVKIQGIETLQNFAISKGGKCLSEIYTTAIEKYRWQCDKNHIWETSWRCIRQGSWCHYCSNQQDRCIDEIKIFCKNKNWICHSSEYVNNNFKNKIECAYGHIFMASFKALKRGIKCSYCT